METIVTKPSVDNMQTVIAFRSQPEIKTFEAIINDGGEQKRIQFDIQPLIDQMNTTQRTIVKEWYKRLSVLAINELNKDNGIIIADTDITGDIFNEI